jgi:putative transposase
LWGQIFTLDTFCLFVYSVLMARPLRIQFPGALYHVTNRGNNRESLFKDDVDRQAFLTILAQSVDTYQIRIHSFVLMNNHWHLLVQTPLANLSEFMRRFNITYTSHYNRRHKRVGHLYQGRYKSFLVEEDGYLNMVSRYIHLNPVRISSMKEVELEKRLEYLYGYKWSSLRGYVEAGHELDWVEYEMVLADYGKDRSSAAESYRRHLFEDIKSDLSIKSDVVGQSVLGSESFVVRIKQTYLEQPKDRERPAIAKINKRIALDQVLAIAGQETHNATCLKRRVLTGSLVWLFFTLTPDLITARSGNDSASITRP